MQRHRIKRALEANHDIKYNPFPNPDSYAAIRRRKKSLIRHEQAHAAAKLVDPKFRLTTVYHVTVTAAAESVRKLRLEYAAKGSFKFISCLVVILYCVIYTANAKKKRRRGMVANWFSSNIVGALKHIQKYHSRELQGDM